MLAKEHTTSDLLLEIVLPFEEYPRMTLYLNRVIY